jgi:hypothetical protein
MWFSGYSLHPIVPAPENRNYLKRDTEVTTRHGISRISFGQSFPLEDILRFGPFLGLALLLFFLWIGGFVFFHVAGFLIHLLLVFAVVFLVIHLFTGARTA